VFKNRVLRRITTGFKWILKKNSTRCALDHLFRVRISGKQLWKHGNVPYGSIKGGEFDWITISSSWRTLLHEISYTSVGITLLYHAWPIPHAKGKKQFILNTSNHEGIVHNWQKNVSYIPDVSMVQRVPLPSVMETETPLLPNGWILLVLVPDTANDATMLDGAHFARAHQSTKSCCTSSIFLPSSQHKVILLSP
jgi:hypothetical protein